MRIVKDAAVWQDMAGETSVHQKINSFLTCAFIMRKDMPDDECVSYAQPLIDMWNQDSSQFYARAAAYLGRYFCIQNPRLRHRCPFLSAIPGIVEDLTELMARELQ